MNILLTLAQAPGPNEGFMLAGFACLAVVTLFVYFLPVVIAVMRGHQNTLAIFVLTLLLGWTFIGWAVGIVWAFTAVENPDHRDYGE